MTKFEPQKGIIRTIILIIVAFLMLSYMGIDLEKAVAEPLFKKNLQYTGEVIKNLWSKITGAASKVSDKDKPAVSSNQEL